ncbi:MAG TPA: peptidylprolyl isomerase [Acidiferrobacterales bacterium]
MIKQLTGACLLTLGVLIAACNPTGPDTSKPIATVNGEVITEKDFEDYLKARQAQQMPAPDPAKEREVVLNEMVNRVLLAQEAAKRKLDEEEDVYFQLKRQRENTLVRATLRQFLRDNPISDEDVKKRYEQEVEKTHKTEYRARHVLVKTEEEAQDVLKQLKAGARFDAVAKKHSIDQRSGKEGGDLGWFNQGSIVPEFFDTVKDMKKGELAAAPVKTEFGWHVIKLEDSRPWTPPGFDQIQANVRQMVQQERIEAMVQDLKAKAKIKSDL